MLANKKTIHTNQDMNRFYFVLLKIYSKFSKASMAFSQV